jgi:hypothetical protein
MKKKTDAQSMLDAIHELPERTVEELRSKVNCYQASAIDCDHRAKALMMEAACFRTWAETTLMKLSEAILKNRQPGLL